MEEELKYHADILILDTYTQLNAKYGGSREQLFPILCQPNPVCTCPLVRQQKELTPIFHDETNLSIKNH